MKTDGSKREFIRAQQVIPGGVNSPVRAFRAVGQDPLFISRAEGSHIYDMDGNEYIDYVCSWGPNILGHAHPWVIHEVQRVCEQGLTFGAPTVLETELAEMIVDAVPAAEQVRLVSSGTEAVMSAVRAARGYTGRNKIVKFAGNYHGHSDGLLVKAGSGLLTEAVPDSSGVPEGYVQYTLQAEYNDRDSVERLFTEQGEEIAAVLVEPVAANMGVVPPEEGFLAFLREITKRYGALLIFDEVITGFRLAYGGAGAYFGVTPDLVTLGKIVGGGMPLAAYCGKKEIMQVVAPAGSVYQAGTLSGNPVAVTAGLETLKILKENPEIYRELDEKGARLEAAFRAAGKQVNRVGSLLSVFFAEGSVTDYRTAQTCDTEAFARYFSHMLSNGIYVAPSQFEAMFVSCAHTDEDLERTVEAIRSLEN